MRRLSIPLWAVSIFAFAGCAGIVASNPYTSPGQGVVFNLSSPMEQFTPGKPPLSSEAVLTFPPFFRQPSNQLCGLAVAKMIASYYHKSLKKESLRSVTEISERMHGVSGQELKNILEDSGFGVAVFAGRLANSQTGLFNEIDRGRPVIVMLKKQAESHYVLVSGYDPQNKLLILDDPAQGFVALSVKRFTTDWEGSGRFSLLAVPEEDLATK